MKSLKIATFCNPRVFLPSHHYHIISNSQMRLQSAHYLYNPDLDIYFKTIAMGQRKPSLGLGGITEHYRGTCPQCC